MLEYIITSLILITNRLLHQTVNILRQRQQQQLQQQQQQQLFVTSGNSTGRWDNSRLGESTDEEIQKDPLIVLRCDRRVFRCPPIFDILLRVLRGYMTASRGLLNHHILSNPLSGSKLYFKNKVKKEGYDSL